MYQKAVGRTIIVDGAGRRRLGDFLQIRRYNRPKNINLLCWDNLLSANQAVLTFGQLGDLVDAFGGEVLDSIRWPHR
jgi:hypothetical protein